MRRTVHTEATANYLLIKRLQWLLSVARAANATLGRYAATPVPNSCADCGIPALDCATEHVGNVQGPIRRLRQSAANASVAVSQLIVRLEAAIPGPQSPDMRPNITMELLQGFRDQVQMWIDIVFGPRESVSCSTGIAICWDHCGCCTDANCCATCKCCKDQPSHYGANCAKCKAEVDGKKNTCEFGPFPTRLLTGAW